MYDITNKESFNNVSNWIQDCRNQSRKTNFMFLVGNKWDLNDKREVSYEDGNDLTERNNILFYETSAKMMIILKKFLWILLKKLLKKLKMDIMI